ncbi:hypothetical protein Tco_0585062 [Tanacetum coccineum]
MTSWKPEGKASPVMPTFLMLIHSILSLKHTCKELISHLATPAEDVVLADFSNYEVLWRSYQSLGRKKDKEALVAQLAQSEMSHQGIIKDFILTAISRLYTSVEYLKNLAGPTSLSYIAGWLGSLGLGRTKEEISKILPNTRNLDIEGSNVWRDRFNEIFTLKYPYVQKIADSHQLPLGELMKIFPNILTAPADD